MSSDKKHIAELKSEGREEISYDEELVESGLQEGLIETSGQFDRQLEST